MKRILTAAIATVSVISLVASGTVVVSAHGNNSGWNTRGGSHQNTERFSDIRVIDYAVRHSETAISLSKVEVEKGAQADLKAFAQANIDSETKHVSDLKTLRQKIIDAKHDDSQSSNKSQDVIDFYKIDESRHNEDKHKSYGWSLLSPEDLAKSPNVDQDYIDVMIKHHTITLVAGGKLIDKVTNTELKKMAQDLMNEHGSQIGQLSTWRAAWYPTDGTDSNV